MSPQTKHNHLSPTNQEGKETNEAPIPARHDYVITSDKCNTSICGNKS